MREMFCRDCHASVSEEHYYVHQHWHLNQDHGKISACPICFAAVTNDNLMTHMDWHQS